MSKILPLSSIAVSFLLITASSAVPQVLLFRTFTSNDGLVSNYVTSLLEDSKGYLWVGTDEGMSRYDGISFKNLTPREGLSFSRVNCIAESHSSPGSIWIGTNGGGVSLLRGETFVPYRIGSADSSNQIGSILEDSSGIVWCGTSDGVALIRGGTVSRFAAGKIGGFVTSLARAGSGKVWVGGRELHLCSATGGSSRVPLPLGRGREVSCLWCNERGDAWIGTTDGTIILLRDTVVVRILRGLESLPAFIAEEGPEHLWVGTDHGLLLVKKDLVGDAIVSRYGTDNGLAENSLEAGIVDREGDLWVGTYSRGISRLGNRSVTKVPVRSTIISPNNSSAVLDHAGHVWLCSTEGLREIVRNDRGAWMQYLHGGFFHGTRDFPASVCVDSSNHLWTAGHNGSIMAFQIEGRPNRPSDLRRTFLLNPGPGFQVTTALFLFVDREGFVWFVPGNEPGVYLVDPRKGHPVMHKYTREDGLPDDAIRAIHEDSEGNIWIGGFGNGLAELKPVGSGRGQFESTVVQLGVARNAIRSILQDSHGTRWVGTRYGGILSMSEGKVRSISLNDGLLSDAVWSIAEDPGGDLWLGTQQGLQRMRRDGGLTFLSQPELTGTPVYSCGAGREGLIWFVTPEGLVMYDSHVSHSGQTPPPVYITRFLVNGEPARIETGLTFPHDWNNMTIDFSGLSLRDGRGLRYQYLLEGVDNDWRQLTATRSVTFGALSPGTYTFRVRSFGADGVVSQPATLQFWVEPPYWQRWWFRISLAMLAIAATGGIIRSRVQRLLEIERIRSRIATDLHDDIGSGLTRIAVLSDIVQRQARQLTATAAEMDGEPNDERFAMHSSIQRVGDTARELVDAMSDVVWSIDPKHDSVQSLVQRLKSFAFEICEAKNIALTFAIDPQIEALKLNPETMRALLLVSKEAVTNIVKHSQCTMAGIDIRRSERHIRLTISDNGSGFDVGAPPSGNGLTSMRVRSGKLGGSFSIESGPGKGSTLHVHIPIPI